MATMNSINNKAYVFTSDTSILAGTNITTTAGYVSIGATSADAVAQNLNFLKSRSGAVITTGDVLGEISFKGHDGTGNITASRIVSTSSGTIATDRVGSDLTFYTHKDTTDAAVLRMTIGTAGNVTIAAPEAGVGLTVASGGVTVTAGDITSTAGDVSIGNIAADTTAPIAYFKKSRAGAVLTTGDLIGTLKFAGYDGTQYTDGAKIVSTSSGTIGDTQLAGDLKFYTHPDSAAADPTLRITLADTGCMTVAAPDSGVALTITDGGLTVTSGTTTITPFATAAAGMVTKAVTTGALGYLDNPAVDGQVLVSASDASEPVWASITAGSNITVTPGTHTIEIAATASELQWTVETDAAFNMAVNNGYICNKGTLVTATLPAAATVGQIINITGIGAGGWLVAQNASQMIHFGTSTTTTGVAGSLASTADRDAIEFICVVEDLEFQVISSVGNITVV